jgi:hypothetical protein
MCTARGRFACIAPKADYGRAIDEKDRRLSYTVIKTIKGRRYVYEQRTWREGKRVRTESRYLGPADGGQRPKGLIRKVADLVAANTLTAEEHGALAAERFGREMEAQQRETFGETGAERAERVRQEACDDLHDRYGFKLGPSDPTPVDKTPSAVNVAKENPSERSEGKGSAAAASAAETMSDATTGDMAAHGSE